MRNEKQRLSGVRGVLLAALVAWSGAVFAAPGTDPGDAALAERMVETARLTLAARYLTPAHYRMAGALLAGASRLSPREPRFARLWADAMLQARDTAGAMAALKAYIKIEPDDRPALIQLSDLQANAFETMDKRLDYLLGWVDDTRLPEEVRSHLAYLAFQVYLERAQYPQSKAMLEQAGKLNPLNLEVLQTRYEQASAEGTPKDRVSILLQILKSNPTQIPSMQRLGLELASVGLAQPSLQFYGLAFNLSNRMGLQISPDAVIAYASELILIGQANSAKPLVDQLVAARPGDYETLALRLMIERAADKKDEAAKTLHLLHNTLFNRLQNLRREGLGISTATTRPSDSADAVEYGSFDPDVKRIKEMPAAESARLSAQYAAILVEIAWLDTYFREAPADAKPIIDAIKQLVPDNDPTLARLEGWGFLFRGDRDQATVKLSAVRDRDVLAELGMIRLMDAPSSKAEGDKLLARHPLGLTGLLIVDALRDRKVALTPNPDVAVPIVEELNKFPAQWMTILDQPQNFYKIDAEPLKGSVLFGEPMLVRVTVRNVGTYPITLGPEGALHPDLWFEAEFRGIIKQNVPFAAYDRLNHATVLQPNTSFSQIVRVDQGQMAQLLSGSPFPAIQVVLKVRTNPSTTSQQGLAPGGEVVAANKAIDRRSFSYAPASLTTLAKEMQSGEPAVKIARIDLAATVALLLSQQPTEEGKRTATQLVELLKAAQRDTAAPVAIWASTTLARFSGPGERAQLVGRLVNDPNWAARLLGLSSMGPIKMEDQRSIAEQMIAHDTEPVVVAYAKALNELLGMAITAAAQSATQPSTQPTTQPVTQAAATQPVVVPAPETVMPPTTPTGPVIPQPIQPPSPSSPPTSRPSGAPELKIPDLPPFSLPATSQPADK